MEEKQFLELSESKLKEYLELDRKLRRSSYITSLLGVILGSVALSSSVLDIFKEDVFKEFFEKLIQSPAFDVGIKIFIGIAGGVLGYYFKSRAYRKEDEK